MIKALLICDSQGFPFYSKIFDKMGEKLDDALFAGLISAIGTIGRQLFHEEIATITFGTTKPQSHIISVTKDLFSEEKVIYFVFLSEGECNHKLIKQMSTAIFIETKQTLKHPDIARRDLSNTKEKIDKIIENKFSHIETSCA